MLLQLPCICHVATEMGKVSHGELYPPAPLSIPHEAMEDCHVCGYYVPKGSCVFVKVWKLHWDPRIWEELGKFFLERCLIKHANIDVSGQHFEFVSFGSSRWSCLGYTFGLQVSHLTLVQLLQGFEFTTPLNMPIDMTEGLSITLPKATPLEVLNPRLTLELYQWQTEI